MDSGPLVLEISSDEEDCVTDKSNPTSLDWLSDLLGPDVEADRLDLDDVVVVDELSCAAVTIKPNNTTLDQKKGDNDDVSDDDCLVLDGDPDKPVAVAEDKGNGSDDLMIVGEKGQLACRDYPHPRHLCATFPFSSTPHKKHCDQCHCYVCDSLAPCAHWGDGTSSADHCHSTEKEEKWKLARQSLKEIKSVTHSERVLCNDIPISSSFTNVRPSPQLGCNQIPPLSIPQAVRACSTNNFVSPNIINPRHGHQTAALQYSRQRSANLLNKSYPIIPASHSVRQGRPIKPLFTSFKRIGSSRGSSVNICTSRSTYGIAVSHSHQPSTMPHSIRPPCVVVPHRNQHPPVVPRRIQNPSVVGHQMIQHQSNSVSLQKERCPPATCPQPDQYTPSIISNDETFNSRLDEIYAGLESELGLACNNSVVDSQYVVTSQPEVLPIHVNESVHLPRDSEPSISASQPDAFHPSSGIDCRLNTSVDPSSAPATTDPNSYNLDSNLFNGSSQCSKQSAQQVESGSPGISQGNNLGSENVTAQVWASYLDSQEPLVVPFPKDLSMLPPDPPDLVFDFEDAWSNL